ncbi:unnamed protein product [Echinostoma caproni]|uniref:Glyco_transf_24 domain-containing protein n=1 Tax=Echinostoma caproni TaxID=27848 RepID=A0A183B4C8_9TREM|nr:unnamed protein product [Echinostoma caproni]
MRIFCSTDSMEGIMSRSRIRVEGITFRHTGFVLPSTDTNKPVFEILGVVNPTSRDAQRLSHILAVLQQSLPNQMRIVLNPIVNLPELPVKNREIINSNPIIPRVEFSHLPGQPILTLGMDAPHGWMVAAVEAVHDLDNLRLADVYGVVEAVYELEYLLLEGHCFTEGSMKPPRGLQLTLGPASDLNQHDTIVMANLGYFQLKAGPGNWHLRIRAGLHRICSVSFFLIPPPPFNPILSFAFRIMMLTVIRHTESPVKFWFLKNYLSPTFKKFIPHMAAEYGFEYELVEYQWPRWLHSQTEKQRIIWGYKILFLDVLFPLNVTKIIYVDADQIVRADLQELADLDLEGAPYGYTPFCDSRKEMDGFRFWKQGYWANHLNGRPYHISALYVVDLHRFRQLAAGDRLRGQYHGLSQDPNSLSNLDQDLPNNMIHQVRKNSCYTDYLLTDRVRVRRSWARIDETGETKIEDNVAEHTYL